MRLLERIAIVVAAFAISTGVIAVLSGGLLAGRDDPGVAGPSAQLGAQFRDLGDAPLAPGARRPQYDSSPPTSGAHVPVLIDHDQSPISDDQLLQALQTGDVVIMYGTRRPPSGLHALAVAIALPFTPALAAAGQAVILARRPGTNGLLGLAWTRLIHVRSASDPQLSMFAQYWLGRGAPHN
jgi:Protein of unknown function (DUF3105)